MVGEKSSLEQQAVKFAQKLTRTVQDVFADSATFMAKLSGRDDRFLIAQREDDGLPLRVEGTPILTVKLEYQCCLDGHNNFLAIDKSFIKVFAGNRMSREPIFRYDYNRNPNRTPAAHIQVHAHRDAFTAAMVRAGKTTPRGSRRANSTGVPAMSELHFPMGGNRFRPCLEDILEMLVEEFGLDHKPGFRAALQAGRRAWRQTQTKTAVRDDPYSAIEALQALGYHIQLRPDHSVPRVRQDRLQQL